MADGTDALSQDDMKDLAAALNRYSDNVERQLAVVSPVPVAGGQSNTLKVERGNDTIMLAVCAAIVAAVFAWNAQQRTIELRIDMQAERLSREQMDNWTAQEVTAIRSYITNGRLTPMQPRPTPKKDDKP